MNLLVRGSAIIPDGGMIKPPLIIVREVGKVYASGEQTVHALDRVCFEIQEGDLVAIMGPSGSGKSTMMHLLGALDVPTTGSIVINGRDISTLSRDAMADLRNRTIGFVFQRFNMLPRTSALRQVMLQWSYARLRATDPEQQARLRLQQVGLGNRLCHHPQQLSGGQQQRVAIARALVNNPKFLLADEPPGALDSKTSAEIMGLFCDLNRQGITVVVVTHNADVARYARRRLMFGDGAIVEDIRLAS